MRTEECGEEIEQQRVSAQQHGAQVLAHQRAEHDRPLAVGNRGRIDLPHRFLCLVNGGDKWQSHLPEFEAVELGKQAVPHGFGGHAGLVRDEEDGSAAHLHQYPRTAQRTRSLSSPALS